MFKNNSIKNRVLQIITEKLEAAQKAHEEHCDMLDAKLEADKKEHADLTVNAIVGRFI